MKTEPASLPSPLPSAEMLLSDEVVFRHQDTEGREAQVRAPLAVGLLYAANALRGGEAFALGYPDDRLGRIARSDGAQTHVHKEAAGTLEGMVAFLGRYTEALIAQVRAELPVGSSGGAGGIEREPADLPAGAAEDISAPAA